MDIRNYTQSDEAQVVDLWNRSCVFDAIDVRKFRRQAILDENFDPSLSWVALDGETVARFAFAQKRNFPYLLRGQVPERSVIPV